MSKWAKFILNIFLDIKPECLFVSIVLTVFYYYIASGWKNLLTFFWNYVDICIYIFGIVVSDGFSMRMKNWSMSLVIN